MKPFVAFVFLFLLAAGNKPARDLYRLKGDYTVTIDGTSNLRDWKEKVCQVSGVMEAEVNTDATINLTGIRISMDVLSIRSDMGRGMDNKTYEALKANVHPEIVFTLSAPLRLPAVRDCATAIPVKGDLLLAGVSKPVTMQVRTFAIDGGNLRFEGYENLKMTDFGVRPPSALFGTMRASPDITIHFKINFINQTISNNLKD